MERFFIFFSLIAVLIIGGCNTVEGIGEDLQGAGRAIEKAGRN
jgi:predicted small secreted protein